MNRTATIAATALMSLSLAAAAHAEPNNGASSDGHNSCELKTPDADVYYPHGTKITVDVGDGSKKETYKCDDGKWVKQARVLTAGGIRTSAGALELHPAAGSVRITVKAPGRAAFTPSGLR